MSRLRALLLAASLAVACNQNNGVVGDIDFDDVPTARDDATPPGLDANLPGLDGGGGPGPGSDGGGTPPWDGGAIPPWDGGIAPWDGSNGVFDVMPWPTGDGGTTGGNPRERCDDGLDNDGNGRIDDECPCLPGMTQACFPGDPNLAGHGPCRWGTQRCEGETEFGAWGPCTGHGAPEREVCDQQDNDCDGQVDQRPDCGGPSSLLTTGELTLGALVVPAGTSLAATCAKGATGARQGTWFPPNWLGTSTGQHLFFAEAQAGHAWDLSQPQATLALAFSFSALGSAASLNTGVKQPIVTLCNADARRFVRYEPKANYDGGTTFRLAVPLAGAADWVRTDGPAGVDLTAVTRVEVQLIAVPETTFTVKWLADGGFTP